MNWHRRYVRNRPQLKWKWIQTLNEKQKHNEWELEGRGAENKLFSSVVLRIAKYWFDDLNKMFFMFVEGK